MPRTGWKKEPLKFSDYSHHKLYGSAENIVPQAVTRDVSGIPVIFQGSINSCVSCSVTWIKQWYEQAHPSLSWEYLAKESNTGSDGATPSQVLEPARTRGICSKEAWENQIAAAMLDDAEKHKIQGYAFLTRYDIKSLYQAISNGPIIFGVDNYRGEGPHMMVAYGIKEDLQTLLAISWWNPIEPDLVEIPISDVTFSCSFFTQELDTKPNMDFLTVLLSKISHFFGGEFGSSPTKKPRRWIPFVFIFIFLAGLALFTNSQKFGSAGVVDKYAPAIAGSGMSSTDTSVPVSSFTLADGNAVSSSTIQFPVYLVIDPNSTSDREKVECNGLDTTDLRFINCYRAISCDNLTNSTSTIPGGAYPHPSGEPVIMSNDNCFYNHFVDVYTNQNVTGTKTFTNNSVLLGDNTTDTGKQFFFKVGQANNPYFKVVGPSGSNTTSSFYFSVDGVSDLQLNQNGTTVGVSSTKGLFLTNGQFGINASTTGALVFDRTTGAVSVNASSTASDTLGGYLKHTLDSWNVLYWDAVSWLSGNHTYTGTNTFSSTTQVAVTPSSSNDVVNLQAESQSVATGTAMTTIPVGSPLYMSTTSTLGLASSATATTAYPFVGFSLGSYTVGQTVSYAKIYGIITSSTTPFTAGSYYYLQDTAGTVGTSKGTFPEKIGLALSATQLYIIKPSFNASISGISSSFSSTNPQTITTGWVPKHIDLVCGINSNGSQTVSKGYWQSNSNGSSVQDSIGEDQTLTTGGFYSTTTEYGCAAREGASNNTFGITVATTTNGFKLTCVGDACASSPRYVQYTASYYDE